MNEIQIQALPGTPSKPSGIKVSDLCLESMFWKMGHYLEIAAIEVNSAVSFLIFQKPV